MQWKVVGIPLALALKKEHLWYLKTWQYKIQRVEKKCIKCTITFVFFSAFSYESLIAIPVFQDHKNATTYETW